MHPYGYYILLVWY